MRYSSARSIEAWHSSVRNFSNALTFPSLPFGMDDLVSLPSASLLQKLEALLWDVHKHPCPHVPNPLGCRKRASVALIIRVRPTYPDRAVCSPTETDFNEALFDDTLRSFFRQQWVQRGDAEILFIRRAARAGDRWTSHVALPGGKRDLSDENDCATSVRECMEEIGLDLTAYHVLHIGNLPERIVRTAWGTVPLMVLCPFVFLLTKFDVPPLRLQPTEVNSVHWIPLRALLSPALRTYERCDISDRLARQGNWLLRAFLRASLGQMLYGAVRLVPAESIFCSSVQGFIPGEARVSHLSIVKKQITAAFIADHAGSSDPRRPLLLWGLTYGIIADFLDLLPAYDISKIWTWPTISSTDVRCIIWIMTYRFRKGKMTLLNRARSTTEESPDILDSSVQDRNVRQSRSVKTGGDGSGLIDTLHPLARLSRSSLVGQMLDGYYKLIRRAVVLTLIVRASLGSVLAMALVKRFQARK